MEDLSTGDWTLIAKILSDEAGQQDLVKIDALAHRIKNLREEIDVLRQRMTLKTAVGPDVFNADLAFNKLHQRIKREGLV